MKDDLGERPGEKMDDWLGRGRTGQSDVGLEQVRSGLLEEQLMEDLVSV